MVQFCLKIIIKDIRVLLDHAFKYDAETIIELGCSALYKEKERRYHLQRKFRIKWRSRFWYPTGCEA